MKDYKGKWEKTPPVKPPTDEDRHLAMERALLISQLLMDPSAFEELVYAINLKPELPEADRKIKLENACKKVKLEQEQIDWLWEYLKHYEPTNNWTGTGW